MAVASARGAHTDEQDRGPQHLQDLRPAPRALAEGRPGRHEQGRAAGQKWPYARPARHLPVHRGRQHLRHHGPVRFGQVHADPPFQPPDRAHCGRDPGRWPERGADGQARAAGLSPAQDVHGVPALRPAAAPYRAGQCCLWPGRAEGAPCPARGEGPLLAGPGGPVRLRAPVSEPALGRHAAARGPGPGAGHRCRDPADGRGFLGAGPADPPRDAGPPAQAAGPAEQDHRLHHPRSGRGPASGQPHCHPEGRRADPGRRARGHPAGPGHRVRAVVPAGREPLQGAQCRPCAAGRAAADADHEDAPAPCTDAAAGEEVRLRTGAGRQAPGRRADRGAHHRGAQGRCPRCVRLRGGHGIRAVHCRSGLRAGSSAQERPAAGRDR